MFGTGIGYYFPILIYLASLIGAVCAVAHPRIGVYLLALIMPLHGGRMRLIQYPLGSHVMELILLGALAGVVVSGGSIFPPKQLRGAIIALCVITYLSLWVGAGIGPNVPLPLRLSDGAGGHTPFGYWFSFMHLPLLFVLVCATIKDKRQAQILMLIMMVAFLWNVKNFWGNVGHRETIEFSDNLRFGMGQDFGGSNGRAAYSTQCTLFLIALFGTIKSLRVRLLAAFLIFAGMYAVLFSYSRGAYAALVLGLLYLGLFRIRWLLVVLAAGLAFSPMLLPRAVLQRVTMTYQEGELDVSSADRLEIWQHALRITAKSPILGVGFDTYRFFRAGQGLLDTHNMFVKALVETGVLGLLTLLILLFAAFYAGHRLFRIASDPFLRALGAGFAAYMVAVMVANLFGDRWTYIDLSANTWILMGLVVLAMEWSNAPVAPAAATLQPLAQYAYVPAHRTPERLSR